MRRLLKFAAFLGSLFLALYFVSGHKPGELDEVFGRNGQETKTAVVKIIPIGSQIEAAKAIMEPKGFRCRMMYHQSYSGDATDGDRKPVVYPPADFLWCDSGDRGFIVTKRRQVIFKAEDGKVASVATGVGLTGP